MDSLSFALRQRPDEAGLLSGALRVETHGVVLQWMRETSFFPREQKVGEVEIPYSHLAEVEIRAPWFRKPRIILRPRSLDQAVRVPGVHAPGQIDLWLSRKELAAARSVVSMLNMKASQALLDRASDPLGI